MIIEFTLGNFRSFNSPQTINFRATGVVSEGNCVDNNNIAEISDNKLLKSIGVYGANASGKSNLILGLVFLKDMVRNSLESEGTLENGINSFRQISQNIEHWGFFQIVLLLEGKKYRYGFTLGEKEIATEWLFGPAEKKETYYFKRTNQDININSEWFKEGANLPNEKLRDDVLFLSFCSSYDGEIAKTIRGFIANKITIDIDNSLNRNPLLYRRGRNNTLTNRLVEDGKKELVLKWMKEAGLIFNDISIKKIEFEKRIVRSYVLLTKNIYNTEGEVIGKIPMNLDIDESSGTQKFYSYIGRFIEKFDNGGVYISDEIDSNFHPSLLKKLINLFNNPNINKANAQLLFSSHDTNLMDPNLMRRDQFYFTEKSKLDETILYSLSDLKGIRNNADFARQYLSGYYGALPILHSYLEENKNS